MVARGQIRRLAHSAAQTWRTGTQYRAQILGLYAALIGDVVLMQPFEMYFQIASNFLGGRGTNQNNVKGGTGSQMDVFWVVVVLSAASGETQEMTAYGPRGHYSSKEECFVAAGEE